MQHAKSASTSDDALVDTHALLAARAQHCLSQQALLHGTDFVHAVSQRSSASPETFASNPQKPRTAAPWLNHSWDKVSCRTSK